MINNVTVIDFETSGLNPEKDRVVEKLPKRFADKIDFGEGCWLWKAAKTDKGYGSFRYGRKTFSAHRLSWILLIGEVPKGMHVLHKCDVRNCVNPKHLYLGSHQDNMDDKVRKGRQSRLFGERNGARKHPESLARGENNSNSKLTQLQVEEIRRLHVPRSRGEFSAVGLSKKFGVSDAMIGHIVRGEYWVNHAD